MNNDRVEGAVRNFTGKAEEAVGNTTGDAKTQAEGMADKVAGKVQNAFGNPMVARGVTFRIFPGGDLRHVHDRFQPGATCCIITA